MAGIDFNTWWKLGLALLSYIPLEMCVIGVYQSIMTSKIAVWDGKKETETNIPFFHRLGMFVSAGATGVGAYFMLMPLLNILVSVNK